MSNSYRKNPCYGTQRTQERTLRRRARRQRNKVILAELVKEACIDDAADEVTFIKAQEADGEYWGSGWFGHYMADPENHDWATKLIRK